jgi:hypothetical protein
MRAGGRSIGGVPGPWYRLQPCAALTTAVVLFAGVSILQWFNDASGQAVAILYVFPVALLAVTFGLRGGLVAAAAGFAVFALFEIFHSTGDIDVDGWVVRAAALFLLGGLLGRASDQTAGSERAVLEEQRRCFRLEDANRRYSEAIELSDSIVQQMVAAKWLVEQGRTDQAIEELATTIAAGEQMITELLPRKVAAPATSPELPLIHNRH